MQPEGQRSTTSFRCRTGPSRGQAGMGAGIGFQLSGHIFLHDFVINLDVVFPGADNGEVAAGHGAHAAVRTAVELEFEFVGESRTMQFVLIVHGQLVAEMSWVL